MAFRELKVFCGAVACVLMSFPQMVLAEDKIDVLIQAYNLESEYRKVIHEIRPSLAKFREIEGQAETNELIRIHKKEEIDLLENAFSSEKIIMDLRDAFQRTYTNAEIEAAYEFSKTELGRSFLSKNLLMNTNVQEVVVARSKKYLEDVNVLFNRQYEEFQALTEKLKNDPLPISDTPEKITFKDIVKFGAYREDGELIGYKTRPGERSELFNRSLFQKGDIVTSVNGVKTSDIERAGEVLNILKTEERIHFEVNRDGEMLGFVVDLLKFEEN